MAVSAMPASDFQRRRRASRPRRRSPRRRAGRPSRPVSAGALVEVRDLVPELRRAGDHERSAHARSRWASALVRRSVPSTSLNSGPPSTASSSRRTSGEPPTTTTRRRPAASHGLHHLCQRPALREPPQRAAGGRRDEDDLAPAGVRPGRTSRAEAREAGVERAPRGLELRLGEPRLARVRDPGGLELRPRALRLGPAQPERGEEVGDREVSHGGTRRTRSPARAR